MRCKNNVISLARLCKTSPQSGIERNGEWECAKSSKAVFGRAEVWIYGTQTDCLDSAQRLVPRAGFPGTYCNVPGSVPHEHKNIWQGKAFELRAMVQKRVARLNSMDERAHLAHECCVYDVSTKRSFINHPSPDIGFFANQAFTKGETISYYYGTRVY